jgi:hypothetical protein
MALNIYFNIKGRRDNNGDCGKCHGKWLHNVYSTPHTTVSVKHVRDRKCVQKFCRTPEGKIPLAYLKRIWENNIEMDLKYYTGQYTLLPSGCLSQCI